MNDRASEMIFCLYALTLRPELFDVRLRRVSRDGGR
jgi:hypothetical protein